MSKTYVKVMPRMSDTGRLCTLEYALKHPKTTTIERRKITKK